MESALLTHTACPQRLALYLNSTTLKRADPEQKPCSGSISVGSTPAEEGRNFTQANDTALVEGLSWGVTLDSQTDPLN